MQFAGLVGGEKGKELHHEVISETVMQIFTNDLCFEQWRIAFLSLSWQFKGFNVDQSNFFCCQINRFAILLKKKNIQTIKKRVQT